MLLKLEIFGRAFAVAIVGCLSIHTTCLAQEKETTEPIFRVPKIAKLPDPIVDNNKNPSVKNVADALENGFAGKNAKSILVGDNPNDSIAHKSSVPDADPAAAANSPAPVKSPAARNNTSPDAPSAIVAANSAIVPATSPDKKLQPAVPEDVANKISENVHPLDRAVDMAHTGLKHMQQNIHDYTAILVKRELVAGELSDPHFMKVKIRNERNFETHSTPFSVYLKFLKPRAVSGREVIWVRGANQDKLIAHETGIMGLKRFYLDPAGFIAMKGNRYPIYDAGLENLVVKLIEKAERDRAAGDCRVSYVAGAMINNRSCTLIEVVHPEKKFPYEFYKAKVYIDDELNIPVRYAAYAWPAPGQKKPPLLEEYTYINVKLNVGLTDRDFDPNNPEYKYPKR